MSKFSTFILKILRDTFIGNMMLELVQLFFELPFVNKVILFFCFFIMVVIIDRLGFFLFIERILVRFNIMKSYKETIINELKYSIEHYLPFVAYYDNKKPIVHFIPYIDNLLYITNSSIYMDKTKALQEIRRDLNKKDFKIAMYYYNESTKLLSWLKLVREVPLTNTSDTQYMEKYLRLCIPPVQQGTYDPTADFPYYMDTYVIPKVKELTEKAEDLINILSSKHIT